MKILLIGEYSRLHNSLKEGLLSLGHDVTILGFNDGFKAYPVDFPLVKKWDSGLLKKVKLAILQLTGFDLTSYFTYRQFCKNQAYFQGFDVVQLINENSFYCDYRYETKILNYLFRHNTKVFLLSCGDDYVHVNYNFNHPDNPSIVQPYLAGKIADKAFSNVLKFRTPSFKKLHHFIQEKCSGVMASDLDYHLPWQKPQTQDNLTPGRVAQSMLSLLMEIGTPAISPKPRGKSPGWKKDKKRKKRTRYPVVKKRQSSQKTTKSSVT